MFQGGWPLSEVWVFGVGMGGVGVGGGKQFWLKDVTSQSSDYTVWLTEHNNFPVVARDVRAASWVMRRGRSWIYMYNVPEDKCNILCTKLSFRWLYLVQTTQQRQWLLANVIHLHSSATCVIHTVLHSPEPLDYSTSNSDWMLILLQIIEYSTIYMCDTTQLPGDQQLSRSLEDKEISYGILYRGKFWGWKFFADWSLQTFFCLIFAQVSKAILITIPLSLHLSVKMSYD